MSAPNGPPNPPPRNVTPTPSFFLEELKERLPFAPKFLLVIILGILLLIGAWSSFFQVEAEEVGVVLRFGKYSRTVQPGLNFKLPFGMETVETVAVRRQLKQEYGFGTSGATNDFQTTNSSEWEREKQMVTGDLNAALVEWVVQYRIDEPRPYLFNVRKANETLRAASESVMRESVGDRTVDEVLTVGRREIEDEALSKLQDLIDKYEMGLRIDQVQLKDVNPPGPVQASFNEVNQAQQQREKSINQASGMYNREIPKARGEADRMISDARGYATQRINEAEGDAARFNSVFAEYRNAPDVTKQRLYLETMNQVIPSLGRKVILDESTNQLLPFFNVDNSSTLPVQPTSASQ